VSSTSDGGVLLCSSLFSSLGDEGAEGSKMIAGGDESGEEGSSVLASRAESKLGMTPGGRMQSSGGGEDSGEVGSKGADRGCRRRVCGVMGMDALSGSVLWCVEFRRRKARREVFGGEGSFLGRTIIVSDAQTSITSPTGSESSLFSEGTSGSDESLRRFGGGALSESSLLSVSDRVDGGP
jgi:hypothetical protein